MSDGGRESALPVQSPVCIVGGLRHPAAHAVLLWVILNWARQQQPCAAASCERSSGTTRAQPVRYLTSFIPVCGRSMSYDSSRIHFNCG